MQTGIPFFCFLCHLDYSDSLKHIFIEGKPFVTLGAGQYSTSSVKLLSKGQGIYSKGCLAPPWTADSNRRRAAGGSPIRGLFLHYMSGCCGGATELQ